MIVRVAQWLIGSFLLLTLLAGLNAALVVLIPTYLYSADALYLPALVDDWLHPTISIRGWITPPANYFFPDLAIILSLRLLVGKSWVLLANAYLQFALLLLTMVLLLSAGRCSQRAWAVALAGLALVATIAFGWDGQVLAPIMASGHHFGAFLISLLSAYAYLKLRDERWRLALIVAMCTLTVAADRLFIVQFSGPFIALIAFEPAASRFAKMRAGALVMGASIVGLFGPRLLRATTGIIGLPLFLTNRFIENWRLPWFDPDRWRGAFDAICGRPGWLWWAALLLALVPTASVLIKTLRNRKAVSKTELALLFLFFGALLGLFVGFIASLGFGLQADRYSIPFYCFPFFALAYQCSRLKVHHLTALSGLAALAMWLGLARQPRLLQTAHTKDPSPLARCLSQHADEFGLQAGYGDYWSAKPLSYFTPLLVNQLERDLRPLFLINNYYWYSLPNRQGLAPNFVVMDRLDGNAVQEQIGSPSHRFSCGETEVYVYNGPSRKNMDRFHQLTLDRIRRWEKAIGKSTSSGSFTNPGLFHQPDLGKSPSVAHCLGARHRWLAESGW